MIDKKDLAGINPKVIEDFGLGNSDWELAQYTFVNPTSSRVTVSPFNPQVSVLFNYPTQPSVSGTVPNTYTPITVAPARSIAVAYDTNNNKVWSGNRVLGSGLVYTYSDNPPQTSPATFNTIATVQSGVSSISFSPTSNKIAVCSLTGFQVTIIDATTEVVLADTAIGFLGANWIEWNSIKNTWYVSTSSNQIAEIDCVTNALLTLIALPVGVIPQNIAFNPNNNTIYVCDKAFGNDQIFKIDCVLNVILSVIPTALYVNTPSSIEINPTLNKAYVGSFVTTSIWTFDTLTDTFISNVTALYNASDFQIHPPSNSIYAVGQSGSGQIIRINMSTDLVEFSLSFTQLLDRITLAFSPTQNIIYFGSDTAVPYQLNSLTAVSSTVYILGSGGSTYNDDVRDFFNNPAWVRKIFVYSDNNTNFNQIFSKVTKDANGNACFDPQNAAISVGTMQFQQRIGQLDFPDKDLILGINQWFDGLTLEPNSNYTMILVFQQLKKSDLLSKYPIGSTNAIDDLADYVNQMNPLKKYSLKDLNTVMPLNSGVRQDINVIQPLNISDFNTALIEEAKIINDGSNKTE